MCIVRGIGHFVVNGGGKNIFYTMLSIQHTGDITSDVRTCVSTQNDDNTCAHVIVSGANKSAFVGIWVNLTWTAFVTIYKM